MATHALKAGLEPRGHVHACSPAHRWAAGIKEMRSVFQRFEAEGCPKESQVWGPGVQPRRHAVPALFRRAATPQSGETVVRARATHCQGGRALRCPSRSRATHMQHPPSPSPGHSAHDRLPTSYQAVWRQHWDFQLAKALEVQFRAGLANLTKSLPEVRARASLPCCRADTTGVLLQSTRRVQMLAQTYT